MNKIFFRKRAGFTLIEMIVAVSIFSIISLISVDIFTSVLHGQRKIFGMQNIHENGYYVMEKMSKEIRMSEIISNDGNFNSLNIVKDNGDINYKFSSDGKLFRNNELLHSNQVEVTGSFYVQRIGDIAPRVTIFINMKNKSNKLEGRANINLQTTISSRSF